MTSKFSDYNFVLVKNFTASECQTGIHATGGAYLFEDVDVSNNLRDGIRLEGGAKATFRRVQAIGNGRDGISIAEQIDFDRIVTLLKASVGESDRIAAVTQIRIIADLNQRTEWRAALEKLFSISADVTTVISPFLPALLKLIA